MNMSRNGIPIQSKPSRNFGRPYRETPNHYKVFATLYRVEEFTKVWLIIPYKKAEVKQLEYEGWKVVEVWERK